MKRIAICVAIVLLAVAADAATLHVSAAASLTDALREIGGRYQKETGDTLLFNFGASSLLARQIIEGVPADVYISADELWMDRLQTRGLIVNKSRKSILSNSLAIVVPNDSTLKISSPQDLATPAVRNIAVAEPATVPAGIYAKEYLRKLRVWDRITGKLIPTDNVRSTLAAVESGNVDAGIVYKTDAMTSRAVRIAYDIPAAAGPKISYPAAVVADSKDKAPAQRFLDYLQSAPSRDVFLRFGFILP